jgi:hypothetical protein
VPVTDLDRAMRFSCDLLGGIRFMTVDDAALARFGRSSSTDLRRCKRLPETARLVWRDAAS